MYSRGGGVTITTFPGIWDLATGIVAFGTFQRFENTSLLSYTSVNCAQPVDTKACITYSALVSWNESYLMRHVVHKCWFATTNELVYQIFIREESPDTGEINLTTYCQTFHLPRTGLCKEHNT